MPLHLGKVAGLMAILTIGAFILWLLFGSIITGERADQAAHQGAQQGGGAMPAPGAPAQSGY
jgi:hypothetical protein